MARTLNDALGRAHDVAEPRRRIVSLVPSLTETIYELGAGDQLVGVTEYCIHPAAALATKMNVGGTKNPSVERILELRPDLVIANKEENRRRDVERIEAGGVPVFVTYSLTVKDGIEDVRILGEITGHQAEAEQIVRSIGAALQTVGSRSQGVRPKVVALIWKNPYMAVGNNTFAHDLLLHCGAENPFMNAERRYPRIDEAKLVEAAPDVILLPTEPYAFGEEDRLELLRLDCPAAMNGRVHVIEGELLTWYGPRMARALEELSALLAD